MKYNNYRFQEKKKVKKFEPSIKEEKKYNSFFDYCPEKVSTNDLMYAFMNEPTEEKMYDLWNGEGSYKKMENELRAKKLKRILDDTKR